MERIKIKDTDKNNIMKLIGRFRIHKDDIISIEEKIEILQKEKDRILNGLEATRSDERIFTNALCEKYGVGHFDVTNPDFWILDKT